MSNFKENIIKYENILKLEPNNGVVINDLGNCYFHLENFKKAIFYYLQVINIKEIPDVYNNIGASFGRLMNYHQSLENYFKSVNIQPNYGAYYGIGNIYYYLKDYKNSIKYYEKALSIKKNNDCLYNLSFPYLALHNFDKGYPLYETRLLNKTKVGDLHQRLEIPQLKYWDGEKECQHLLVVSEQGLGDNFWYYRYIIELSHNFPDMSITYFTREVIAHVFKKYNNINIVKNIYDTNIFSYKAYIMSLPCLLAKRQIIPNSINYIKVNQEKNKFWKKKLKNLKKFRIGIVWNGLLKSYMDKSIPLKLFKPLLDLNVDIICLHKQEDMIGLDTIDFKDKLNIYDIDKNTPFEDTIAIINNIDLLITVDTCTTYLGGILGIKTLLLLDFYSDWRWFNYPDDRVPWYDSVKLIRMKKPKHWKFVIKQVCIKIKSYIENTDNLGNNIKNEVIDTSKVDKINKKKSKSINNENKDEGGKSDGITKIRPIINDNKKFNRLIKGKEGYIVYNKNDIYIGRAVEKYGEFSEHEVKIFEALCQPGDVVIDIGANIGTHALAFSRIVGPYGKVYAYEPQRIVFYTLCANVALNSIVNIECKHQALGNKKGYIQIPDFDYNQEGNYGGISIDKFKNGTKVELIKLDSLLDLPRLKFIKIDVEGMETNVIEGGRNLIEKFKPILYVENDRLEKSNNLIAIIKSLNYRIYWHNPPLYNENNYANDSENLYPGIVSMNMLCIHKSIKLDIPLYENDDPDFHPLKKK